MNKWTGEQVNEKIKKEKVRTENSIHSIKMILILRYVFVCAGEDLWNVDCGLG